MKNYVQIGSNVGLDHFFEHCKSLTEKCNIYLIEPNESLISDLEKNYQPLKDAHEIHILNYGIVTEKTKEVNNLFLYENQNEYQSGMSSILLRKSHQKIIGKITFAPMLFSSFCDMFNIKEIELLSIDTEGFDYEILNSIDPSILEIKKVYFEYWPFEDDDMENKISTGNSFLNEVLKKYSNYNLKDIVLDGQKSYVLEKQL